MNKNAIKKFAIDARNKLIASVTDKAGMLGITPDNCSETITKGADFEVYKTVAGTEVTLNKKQCEQRGKLVDQIHARGFEAVVEEVAYTWFNRICAIRFMEVNDYMYPVRVRVLSSEKEGKNEPDVVTMAPDIDWNLTDKEREEIIDAKMNNRLDDLFRMLFIKQCNLLHEVLPGLFEETESWMFTMSYEQLREKLSMYTVISLMQLGARAFDEISGEVVQTSAYIFRKKYIRNYRSNYFDLTRGMSECEKETLYNHRENVYHVNYLSFKNVPNYAMAYWLSEKELCDFGNTKFSEIFTTREGMTTANNELFLKMWTEVSCENINYRAKNEEDEGDFLCTEEAVRAMFADQRDVSGDVEVLDEFGLDVLNQDTIKGYRIIFEQLHSGHPWNALENDEFLMKLRAAAKNKNGTLSPTIAGLLFFGEAYHITEVFPNYFLDYREECDDKAVRWLFRTHSNEGDWSGNIYDFFCKVRTRMDDDVAVPFANRRNGYRVDRVDVHDALEEALANALAHANYYGRRGILVVKKGKELSISNPGTIRVTKEEFYAGGNSDPRNPNILKMFGFVNVGERAGSGVDKIMTAWAEQNWKKPEFDFSERNDRVTLKLEVGQVVYIPGVADIRDTTEGDKVETITAMSKDEKVLAYIRQNGSISMKKVMEIGNKQCSFSSGND